MTKRFAAASNFCAQNSASCGVAFSAETFALALILGTALAVSIIICGIIGIVRLISIISLLVIVRNVPHRLRTAA